MDDLFQYYDNFEDIQESYFSKKKTSSSTTINTNN